MNKKLVWLSILSIFFLAWGVSGFSVHPSHRASVTHAMLPSADTPATAATASAMIPVTGQSRPGWGILVLYGLIVLATLTLILALLDSANQSTASHPRRKASPAERQKNSQRFSQ